MENLSQEIIDIIVDHVQRLSGRAPYAIVSRSWQTAVEARTMRRISLFHQQDLETFGAIFSETSPLRRRSIRDLCLITRLPTLSRTPEDHEKSLACFYGVIIKLCQELGSWEFGYGGDKHGAVAGSLRLNLRWMDSDNSQADSSGEYWPF